jgi:uncharacterized protein (DUF1778 family)
MTYVLTTRRRCTIVGSMASKSEHVQIRVTRRQKAALKRLAAAAGQDVSSYVLARALPVARTRFEELVALLAEEPEPRYALAELNDLLSALVADELSDAVAHADLAGLPALLQNYIAAMVEQACYRKGVRPPSWTVRITPLEAPYFAAPFEGLRLHLVAASPVPFKRRNIFVDAAVGDRV